MTCPAPVVPNHYDNFRGPRSGVTVKAWPSDFPSVMPNASQPSIGDLVRAPEPTFSFEFFPPKTPEGERHLWQAIRELEPLRPSFVSITYGAGGTTRDTHRLGHRAHRDRDHAPADGPPHRGQPLGGRAAQRDRPLRRGRHPQRARRARRPARRPAGRLGSAPRGLPLRGGAGPLVRGSRRLLRRRRRVPGEAPAFARPRVGRALLRAQVPRRAPTSRSPSSSSAGRTGRGCETRHTRRAATRRSCRASCR